MKTNQNDTVNTVIREQSTLRIMFAYLYVHYVGLIFFGYGNAYAYKTYEFIWKLTYLETLMTR